MSQLYLHCYKHRSGISAPARLRVTRVASRARLLMLTVCLILATLCGCAATKKYIVDPR